jgi:hypothetical protein
LFRGEERRYADKLLSKSFDDAGKERGGFTETMLQLINEIELKLQAEGVSGAASVKVAAPTGSAHSLQTLSLVEKVAKGLPGLLQSEYYVLIDDLDLHWSNDPVQNSMISALFSAMAKLNRHRRIKFVVAIREDIYRQLPIEDKDKSRDWIVDVGWDKASLREMVERRMYVLHNVQSTHLWGHLLPQGALDAFLEFGVPRPRAVLRQVQLSIQAACDKGHDTVQEEDLVEGIRKASVEKLDELDAEVRGRYPGIGWMVKHFFGARREFSIKELQDVAETIYLKIEEGGGDVPAEVAWAGGVCEKTRDFAYCLMDAGFLLVKTSRIARPQELLERQAIENLPDPWFAIRPVYCPALQVVGT